MSIADKDIAGKLTEIAENQQKVYNAGYAKGVMQGEQTVNKGFWDTYLNSGNRTDYEYAFCGSGWTDEAFKPTYTIKPSSARNMFYKSKITDLTRNDITLQITSNCGNCYGIFESCTELVKVGNIDVRGAGNFSNLFKGCSNLESVENIYVSASRTGNDAFSGCSKLTEIRFSGEIGQNLDMSACPLSKASIESIIGCLSDTATGKTLTLKKTAKEAAFTEDEWVTLITPKSNQYDGNWTISLV